ncbi:hypothetical protein FQA39_LY08304 [Lamprigera yunnana]|nr:hypothetical protein FQA39_LY08304 [Lamprigera yunnana]
MGRNNGASNKEKRQQRKEEQYKLKVSMLAVERANKLLDPLEPFPAFQMFKKNNIDAVLYAKKVIDLDVNVKDWIFNLTKRNMQNKYDDCCWGWDDKKKLEELMDESAWYLIVKLINGKLLGFSHFRFDIDDAMEVLYCYELQLEPEVQRKGLGKFMMQVLELIAFTNGMKKVVLTVLKHNNNSNFFKAINYQIDYTSPDGDEYAYEILSKINKKSSMSK